MIDINLVPPKNLLSKKERQTLRQFITVSVILTVATAVIGISIFFTKSTINTLVFAANSQKESLNKSINSKIDAANQLKELNEKISGIKEIRNSYVDFGKIVGDLAAVLLPATKINSFTLDTLGNITASLSSSNLESFGLIVDKMSAEKQKTHFNQITVSNIKESGNAVSFILNMKYDFSKQNDPQE